MALIDANESACPNEIKVPRKLVEELLLDAIKRDLFTPEGIDLFKRETTLLLTEHKARKKPSLANVRKRLAVVETEIDNIMTAIKSGILTPTTKAELEKAESSRTELEKALRVDTRGLDQIEVVLPRAVDHYKERRCQSKLT